VVPLANSISIPLSFLFQRLKWPVPMSRWRTAKEIRNLLNDSVMRSSTTKALLDYLDQCKSESEVCEILTIVFLTSPVRRPTRTALASRIHCPSILADIMLERIYGLGRGIGGWRWAHSGRAPADFEGGRYFEEHKTAHVPPIFVHNLKHLENIRGDPFLQQWAYEWKILCDKLGTHYTGYPHYFDDVLDSRAGVVGQYWQRMREVYLSAYLRTLAYAVSQWRMPQKIAEDYCLDMVHGIAGLFDVEPLARPLWLADFPERFCAPSADFTSLICELVQAARSEGMRLVSLDTPIASSVQKFANLTLSAHLVTSNYNIPDGDLLYEKMPWLSVKDTFELKGPPGEITIQEAGTEGKMGDQVAVCSCLFPVPYGTWQSDYFSMGIRIPAPYSIPDTEIRCTHESIDCITSDGKVRSRTLIWNDNWVPPYPKGGSNRCGTATMIDQEMLAQAMEKLGRKLAFFMRLRIWDREKEYGEYSESKRTFFLPDLGE
jgi:hypothetical protein